MLSARRGSQMMEEREREYVGVGVCGYGREKLKAEKLKSWGQGKRVCGGVSMWVGAQHR
jgi:hypothetical protein